MKLSRAKINFAFSAGNGIRKLIHFTLSKAAPSHTLQHSQISDILKSFLTLTDSLRISDSNTASEKTFIVRIEISMLTNF